MNLKSIIKQPVAYRYKLSDADLKAEVEYMSKVANKRLERLDKSGLVSYAKNYIEGHGGDFGVEAGDSRQMMLEEYNRVRRFLESKTSTPAGARDVMIKQEAHTNTWMAARGLDYASWSPENKRLFWRAFNTENDIVNTTLKSELGLDQYKSEQAVSIAIDVWEGIGWRWRETAEEYNEQRAEVGLPAVNFARREDLFAILFDEAVKNAHEAQNTATAAREAELRDVVWNTGFRY